jgi:hemerythrin-like metal-binding protein
MACKCTASGLYAQACAPWFGGFDRRTAERDNRILRRFWLSDERHAEKRMLTWGDEYRIGNEEMDGEHIILFALLNQLDINIGADRAASCVADLLRALLSYISFHFAHEEALMASFNYPDLGQHHLAHEALIAETTRLSKRAASVDAAVVALEMRAFVQDWLLRHIREEDLRYAVHIRKAA